MPGQQRARPHEEKTPIISLFVRRRSRRRRQCSSSRGYRDLSGRNFGNLPELRNSPRRVAAASAQRKAARGGVCFELGSKLSRHHHARMPYENNRSPPSPSPPPLQLHAKISLMPQSCCVRRLRRRCARLQIPRTS